MSSADSGRAAPSAIMPPQVTAAGFAVILGFMLLFPFLRISFGGAEQPRLLIHLFKTDFGFNIFAVLLLLTPLAGIIIAMMARSTVDQHLTSWHTSRRPGAPLFSQPVWGSSPSFQL